MADDISIMAQADSEEGAEVQVLEGVAAKPDRMVKKSPLQKRAPPRTELQPMQAMTPKTQTEGDNAMAASSRLAAADDVAAKAAKAVAAKVTPEPKWSFIPGTTGWTVRIVLRFWIFQPLVACFGKYPRTRTTLPGLLLIRTACKAYRHNTSTQGLARFVVRITNKWSFGVGVS